MKNYEKPVVIANEELAEGVYAGSGDCYTFKGTVVQQPALGMDYYVVQIDGYHHAPDGHHSNNRTVKVEFNQNVTYVESMAKSYTGSGSSVLYLEYEGTNGSYHNNSGWPDKEYIGLGDLKVKSAPGLMVKKVTCTYCSHCCDQH